MVRRGWSAVVLIVLLVPVLAQRAGGKDSTSTLVDDKLAAAAAAREGRALANAEHQDASGLDRRERREEKKLETELQDSGSIKSHVGLSRADRKEDAQVGA